MSNAVTDFETAARETELPTAHWTAYLTLEAAEKTDFFRFMRRVALGERCIRNQPKKNDEDFARELVSNQKMAEIIYSLAKKIAQNPDDDTKVFPFGKVLEAGIPVDTCDPKGKVTALHLTSYTQDKEIGRKIAEILLDKGACLDARDSTGRTPLFIAAGLFEGGPLVKFLIEKGASINNHDESGSTPLLEFITVAASSNRESVDFRMIEFLVSHPDMDWTLPGNAQRPIEFLESFEHRISEGKYDDETLKIRAILSLIQEPVIKHLRQQLGQQRLPEGPASGPATPSGDRAPS